MTFIWGSDYFCTKDGFFRILKKNLSEVISTRLYLVLIKLNQEDPLKKLHIRFDIASGKDVKFKFMRVISKYLFILSDLCFLASMLLCSCSRKKMWVWKKKPTNTYLHKFNFSLKEINMSWVEYSFTFANVRQKECIAYCAF